MFPHEHHRHPGYISRSVNSLELSGDDTRQYQAASSDSKGFRSLQDRPRGRSYDEGVGFHTKLPSMASLISSSRQVQEHRPQQNTLNPIAVYERKSLSRYFNKRCRSQTLPQVSLSTTESAFADPHVRSHYSTSPRNNSSRWSPYKSISTSRYAPRDPISLPLGDFEDESTWQNRRQRRTSPRQRLAASKARAHAMQMTMEGENVLFERNYEAATQFMPQTPISMGLSVALPKPLHPPSSVFVDEFDTSSNKKSSRYLREIDRRSILARLDHGEKQSALAKEFRVTRSAICNLNKHRDLVLARQHENPLAKHPKRPRDKQESESDIRTVVQVALEPTEQLIPLLKSCNISDSVFRDYCDRLIASIVEEVLVWTHNIASCGVAIAPGGSPMISIFQTIEPEFPIGHINLNLPQFGSPEVEMVDLPSAITTHYVFLFYAFTDTAGRFRVAKSIRKLLDRGAMEEMLCLVTLAVSTFTIGELQREYPNLRIVTAHIEHEDKHGQKSKLHTLASRVTEIY